MLFLLLTDSVDNLVNNVWKKFAIADELGRSANWFNFEPDKINTLDSMTYIIQQDLINFLEYFLTFYL